MKYLKQLTITFIVTCVLAVGATAAEPQKNDPKPPPPPKEKQDVPKAPEGVAPAAK